MKKSEIIALAIRSETAKAQDIDNSPRTSLIERDILYVFAYFQQIKFYVEKITSWYRCPELNKAVKGASDSKHMTGRGFDFRPNIPKDDMMYVLRGLAYIPFYKAIMYDKSSHIHLSFRDSRVKNAEKEFILKKGNDYVYYKF